MTTRRFHTGHPAKGSVEFASYVRDTLCCPASADRYGDRAQARAAAFAKSGGDEASKRSAGARPSSANDSSRSFLPSRDSGLHSQWLSAWGVPLESQGGSVVFTSSGASCKAPLSIRSALDGGMHRRPPPAPTCASGTPNSSGAVGWTQVATSEGNPQVQSSSSKDPTVSPPTASSAREVSSAVPKSSGAPSNAPRETLPPGRTRPQSAPSVDVGGRRYANGAWLQQLKKQVERGTSQSLMQAQPRKPRPPRPWSAPASRPRSSGSGVPCTRPAPPPDKSKIVQVCHDGDSDAAQVDGRDESEIDCKYILASVPRDSSGTMPQHMNRVVPRVMRRDWGRQRCFAGSGRKSREGSSSRRENSLDMVGNDGEGLLRTRRLSTPTTSASSTPTVTTMVHSPPLLSPEPKKPQPGSGERLLALRGGSGDSGGDGFYPQEFFLTAGGDSSMEPREALGGDGGQERDEPIWLEDHCVAGRPAELAVHLPAGSDLEEQSIG